ncbi:YcfL family protein [Pseudomonas sp.]|uniref:YcfL family protein n=1 Tax=Pseudomonas sp. TaxID=306 RepID=UPI003D09A3A6
MHVRILGLAATMLLAGCQTQPAASPHPHLVIGPRAGGYLEIESVQEGKASGDLLRAGVRLHSRSLGRQELRYRFEWLDASGFEIPGLAARWELLELRPRVSHSLDRVAPSPRAVAYRIHLFDTHTPPANASGSNQ